MKVATRTIAVGRHMVTWTLSAEGTMVCRWAPSGMPKRLNRVEQRKYLAGRDHALSECAQEIGIAVAIVEHPNPLGLPPLIFHPDGRREVVELP